MALYCCVLNRARLKKISGPRTDPMVTLPLVSRGITTTKKESGCTPTV